MGRPKKETELVSEVEQEIEEITDVATELNKEVEMPKVEETKEVKTTKQDSKPNKVEIIERYAHNTKSNKVYKLSQFGSEQKFNSFLKSKDVKELKTITGEPVIEIEDKEAYLATKEAELEAREKALSN